MIKKYLGVTLISASLAIAGCSSNDDDGDSQIINPTDPAGPVDPVDPAGPVDPVGGEGEGEGDGGGVAGVFEVPQEYTAPDGTTLTLAESLQNDGRFNELLNIVNNAGLTGALDGGPLTIFAPTDAVLAALPEGTLPTDQQALADIVTGHVVPGALTGGLVAENVGSSVQTSTAGVLLPITQEGDQLLVGGVAIVQANIFATNGIIHVLDGVIGVDATAGGEVEGEGGEETPPPVVGGDGTVDPGENDFGASLNNLSSVGFTDYVTVHNASGLGTVYDDNAWTAFIPDNASIPDAALASEEGAAFAILNNHIITTGVVAFADLSALGDTTTNSGLAVTFAGSPAAPTVNGFTITEITSPGNAALYSINGLLQ